MQKILLKRARREFKENIFRYAALGLLIAMGMYLIVSIVGAAETVISGVEIKAEENLREDGEFTVFAPLTKAQESKLITEGISLEKAFYIDFELKDTSKLRVFRTRDNINRIALDEGTTPEKEGEAVLEKRYCQENDISIGDEIVIADKKIIVTGIGSVPDYDAVFEKLSDNSVRSKLFGLIFVNEETYKELKDTQKSSQAEVFVYAYRLNHRMTNDKLQEILQTFFIEPEEIEDTHFQEYWDETGGRKGQMTESMKKLTDGSKSLQEAISAAYGEGSILQKSASGLSDGMRQFSVRTNELLDEYFNTDIKNVTQFLPADKNPRINASADDQIITKIAGLVAGVIVMILFTYVISVFVIHGIEKESSVIGTLYALGVKRNELMLHYLMLPVIVTFIAGLVGTLLGYSKWGITQQMGDCYNYFSTPFLPTAFPAYLLFYSLFMPALTAVAVNCIVIRKRLSVPVLRLLQNDQKNKKGRQVSLGKMGFINRFRIRQMLRELRTGLTVFLGMFIAMLIFMLGLDCYVMCMHLNAENKADTKFEYMYTYKYPEKGVPKEGEPCFAKALNKEIYGYNLEVTLLGIENNNPYFDANVKQGKNRVVLSSAMAQKYQLSKGDDVILKDEEEDIDYAFHVDSVASYSSGMYVFMDIESMRDLMSQRDDYYNVVLSDVELDIDPGRLYTVSTREEINKSADIFVEMTMPLITMLTGVSVLIFCVVMYLMMKVMVDRSVLNISLFKIFGYRTREIRKLYLNGNLYIIAISAAVAIPLAKKLMDAFYPVLISNIACGMNLTFGWKIYIGIYGSIIVLYLLINQILVRKLKKISPAEVLKNRE